MLGDLASRFRSINQAEKDLILPPVFIWRILAIYTQISEGTLNPILLKSKQMYSHM